MNPGLKDILSGLNSEIDQETLLKYLQDKLSPEERHDVEKLMVEDNFDSDAFDGLSQLKDQRKLTGIIEQLNIDLRKKTDKKKIFRDKLRYTLQPWIIVAIIIILLIAVIGFVLVNKLQK